MNKRLADCILADCSKLWDCEVGYRVAEGEDGSLILCVFFETEDNQIDAFGLKSLLAYGLASIRIKQIKHKKKSKVILTFK